jgi:hypothetical protein
LEAPGTPCEKAPKLGFAVLLGRFGVSTAGFPDGLLDFLSAADRFFRSIDREGLAESRVGAAHAFDDGERPLPQRGLAGAGEEEVQHLPARFVPRGRQLEVCVETGEDDVLESTDGLRVLGDLQARRGSLCPGEGSEGRRGE